MSNEATVTKPHGLAGKRSNNPAGRVPIDPSERKAKLTVYAKPRHHASVRAFVASLYPPASTSNGKPTD